MKPDGATFKWPNGRVFNSGGLNSAELTADVDRDWQATLELDHSPGTPHNMEFRFDYGAGGGSFSDADWTPYIKQQYK